MYLHILFPHLTLIIIVIIMTTTLSIYPEVGITPVGPKPRYSDPMSVNWPALFRKVALGPTLLTLDRNAPK